MHHVAIVLLRCKLELKIKLKVKIEEMTINVFQRYPQ